MARTLAVGAVLWAVVAIVIGAWPTAVAVITWFCLMFRHTAATLMLEGAADTRFIQQLVSAGPIVSCTAQFK